MLSFPILSILQKNQAGMIFSSACFQSISVKLVLSVFSQGRERASLLWQQKNTTSKSGPCIVLPPYLRGWCIDCRGWTVWKGTTGSDIIARVLQVGATKVCHLQKGLEPFYSSDFFSFERLLYEELKGIPKILQGISLHKYL